MKNKKAIREEMISHFLKRILEVDNNIEFGIDVNFSIIDNSQPVICSNVGHLYNKEELHNIQKYAQRLLDVAASHIQYLSKTDFTDQFNEAKQLKYLQDQEDRYIRSLTLKNQNSKKTYVYLMHNPINGFYKIGHSFDPIFREKTLSAQEPEIYTIHIIEASSELERELHSRFSNKRVRGEWFDLNQTDVEFIKSL